MKRPPLDGRSSIVEPRNDRADDTPKAWQRSSDDASTSPDGVIEVQYRDGVATGTVRTPQVVVVDDAAIVDAREGGTLAAVSER